MNFKTENQQHMNILYLHGLESKLNPQKRSVLERFGTVIAPDLDYHNNPNVFDLLKKLNEEKRFDVVIGSSMGGFMGYYFANTITCPALLFNPALPHRPVPLNIPKINTSNTASLLHFALGGQDDIIKANDNLRWLSENRLPNTDIKISIHNQMGHQIPLDVFEMEVTGFFNELDLLK
ncbi:hypothetical protein SAMN05443667_10810 [Flavobacterium gillisiae]|jgi:hypothetical protein|uniref:Esterase n=1 Tax=Flavobacterium gillisiae TaxID=150146 RepID=A0A1H4DMR0_9FLAO|nr:MULTISPECIES: YqiA/YcfP family alpha/beta fold hydrolase [Flavobacterium]SEA74051.1 hypothetical protein SAMN05443667_10810 [Flavobacterium gillisiae]